MFQANLCRELMLQFAEADQHPYNEGGVLEWLGGTSVLSLRKK
jgi:hypothetical protein